MLHAQFVNMFTRQHIFSNLHWWPGSAAGSKPSIPSGGAGATASQPLASHEACVAPPATLGVLIATAASTNATWLCAPPEANPHVACPCCWARPEGLANAAYDYRTRALVGCKAWNPLW